jgi:hypothetical protein
MAVDVSLSGAAGPLERATDPQAGVVRGVQEAKWGRFCLRKWAYVSGATVRISRAKSEPRYFLRKGRDV